MSDEEKHWIMLDVERLLYVDRGKETILCDRAEFPGPATLVLLVTDKALARALEDNTNER